MDQLLFGEDQTRVVLSSAQEHVMDIRKLAREHEIELDVLGQTGGSALVIEGVLEVPVTELGRAYFGSIAAKMKMPS